MSDFTKGVMVGTLGLMLFNSLSGIAEAAVEVVRGACSFKIAKYNAAIRKIQAEADDNNEGKICHAIGFDTSFEEEEVELDE